MAAAKTLQTGLASCLEVKNQISAATSVSLGYFVAGMVRAWASPAIPSMQQEADDVQLSFLPLSKEEISWISGLAPLGALVAGFIASYPLARFGRRMTLLFAAVLFLGAFSLLGACYYIQSYILILVCRGAMGMAVGFTMPAAQIYVSECSSSSIRGTLGSFPALFMSLGTLLTYVVGAFLPWHYLSFFCTAFPVLLFIGVSALPESPVWLLTKQRDEEAKTSLQWLRKGKECEQEFSLMRDNAKQTQSQPDTSSSPANRQLAGSVLLQRSLMVPLLLSLALMFFQQWSGVNTVIFYTVLIFDAAGSTIEKNLATVIVGITQFLATFVSIFLVDKAGRRILLIISGLIMSASLAAVGAFFYLKAEDAHAGLGWLPLTGLIIFMIGYSVGYAAVPYVVMGELFPTEYRNLFGAISSSFNLTHTFLETLFGFHGVFWIYAACSLVGVFVVLLFLPETKGKTLLEIEAHFRKKDNHQ